MYNPSYAAIYMLIKTLVGCYYKKITTVCACGPTHILIRTHTHSHPYTRSRTHIFSSVGLHFLIRTHTRARSSIRGVMEHGPQCFRLLTINTTHCKNLEKLQKVRIAEAWSPMGPWARWASRLKRLLL